MPEIEGYLDEDDTLVTSPDLGAVPELDIEPDDEGTVPRCERCLRPVKTGGDAAQPTFDGMARNASDACWRSMSGAWRWCSGRRPWQLVIEG